MNNPESEVVVRVVGALSSIFDELQLPSAGVDLAREFDLDKPVELAEIECVYIAQVRDGDIESGRMGTLLNGCWKVTLGGVERDRHPKLASEPNDALVSPTPLLRFFMNDGHILVSVQYGPRLAIRKRCRVSFGDAVRLSDCEVLWRFACDRLV